MILLRTVRIYYLAIAYHPGNEFPLGIKLPAML